MPRGTAVLLLGVLGVGVFLAGLELMITAVALPSIVVDLADWSALRKASWIVNGYLLATIVTMPLAGRAVDRWGARRPFLIGLVAFTLGSLLAGRAQSLEELIGARIVQGIGGGTLVPVATAAAARLFEGRGRPRALGVIGALTFLGMATGPFVGAWIIQSIHPTAALDGSGLPSGVRDALDAPWRYVFYVNVPIGLAALALAWAATATWSDKGTGTDLDVIGATAFSIGLGALLVGLTLAGSEQIGPNGGAAGGVAGLPGSPPGVAALSPTLAVALLLAAAVLGIALALRVGGMKSEPFLDPSWFRSRAFASATIISVLTGYGFATAIIGGAVFIDRVLYGGPDLERAGLGALAAATAGGALASGFTIRLVGIRLTTAVGLCLSILALVRMAGWTSATSITDVAAGLAVFGAGFGLTVTPRSTAAVEALGRGAVGIASASVTVARMIGMAIGLAVLSAFGSTVIDRLFAAIYATPDAYKAFIPAALRDRPLRDGLVVQALETWASTEAARILLGVFLVAAAVMAIALVPTRSLEPRIVRSMDDPEGATYAL